MFPDWLAQGFVKVMLFYGCCFYLIAWRAKKIAREFDKGGAIKGAAQKATAKGISGMIGRILK